MIARKTDYNGKNGQPQWQGYNNKSSLKTPYANEEDRKKTDGPTSYAAIGEYNKRQQFSTFNNEASRRFNDN